MVNYYLATEEQKEYAGEIRKILEKQLKPHLEEYEKADNGLGAYPWEVHKTLAEAGYCGLAIPEEYGGLGLDQLTIGIMTEEMAKIDAGFAFAFPIGGGADSFLATRMPDEKKQWYIDKTLSGEIIGAFALTEPDAGSDAAAMKTTAVRDGDDWILNGTKCFISNGPICDYVMVAAWTDRTKKAREGVSFFLVDKDMGYTVAKKENKMGLKLSETGTLYFDNVRVPDDHMIGQEGKGFTEALGVISKTGHLSNAFVALGIAQAALDYALEYAKTRRQFGHRIVDHQGVGFMIADMQMRTEACRALVYEAAVLADRGIHPPVLSATAKAYVTDCTMQTTLDAVQVLGGYGYMKEYPLEKLVRDAKIFQIFGGTNQIQRKNIVSALAGKDPLWKKR